MSWPPRFHPNTNTNTCILVPRMSTYTCCSRCVLVSCLVYQSSRLFFFPRNSVRKESLATVMNLSIKFMTYIITFSRINCQRVTHDISFLALSMSIFDNSGNITRCAGATLHYNNIHGNTMCSSLTSRLVLITRKPTIVCYFWKHKCFSYTTPNVIIIISLGKEFQPRRVFKAAGWNPNEFIAIHFPLSR